MTLGSNFNYGTNGSLSGYNGYNNNILAGVNQTGNGVSTDFGSLFSSLSLNGAIGPSLANNSGPVGVNSQSMAIATELASMGTSSLLNKMSPTDMPSQYGSMSQGLNGFTGMSLFDILGIAVNGLSGLLPTGSKTSQMISAASPLISSFAGLTGLFQVFKEVRQQKPIETKSSEQAIQEYESA